jgi:hypothetical protein
MRQRVLSLVMAVPVLLLALPAWTEERPCKSTDVVVVDRSKFSYTIGKALAALREADIAGTAQEYAEGSDLGAFAKLVADFRPKLVVAHYSMFAPGQRRRGRVMDSFVAKLEASGTRPLRYVIYSSSFHDAARHAGGRTLAQLRKEGYFRGIEDNRIGLIFVPGGARFMPGNGDGRLRELAQQVLSPANCGG